MRHGYGVRTSAPFGLASHYRPNKSVRASLTSLRSNEGAGAEANPAADRDRRMDDSRGGFVLRARSDPSAAPARRRSLVEKSSSNFKNMLSVSTCYNFLLYSHSVSYMGGKGDMKTNETNRML